MRRQEEEGGCTVNSTFHFCIASVVFFFDKVWEREEGREEEKQKENSSEQPNEKD